MCLFVSFKQQPAASLPSLHGLATHVVIDGSLPVMWRFTVVFVEVVVEIKTSLWEHSWS
jgi:hypothetical protein